MRRIGGAELEDNATTTAHPDCPHCGERSCVAGTTGGGLSCSRCGADVGMGEALAAALAEVARLREEVARQRALLAEAALELSLGGFGGLVLGHAITGICGDCEREGWSRDPKRCGACGAR